MSDLISAGEKAALERIKKLIPKRLKILHDKIKGKASSITLDQASRSIGVDPMTLKVYLTSASAKNSPFDYHYGMLYTESKEARLRKIIREEIFKALGKDPR